MSYWGIVYSDSSIDSESAVISIQRPTLVEALAEALERARDAQTIYTNKATMLNDAVDQLREANIDAR